MEAFPAFFPLAGAVVVIAGEGEMAEGKARLFEGSPAEVRRVIGEAALAPATYAGAALVFIAHPDRAVCEAAARAAQAAGVPLNVTDHPELCDFHTPAIIDRGQIVAAIGTAGAAPIIAALLRAELEAKLPPSLGRLAALFGELRAEIRAAFPDLAQRRAFFRRNLRGEAADAAEAGDMALARQRMLEDLARGDQAPGRVWLIEAPPLRDQLSLAAAQALAEADVLVLDRGVPPDVVLLARRDASRRELAQTDAEAIGAEAAAGLQVVVLAGADRLADLGRALADGIRVVRLAPAPPPDVLKQHPSPLAGEGALRPPASGPAFRA